jgi:hypothetical protein
VTLKDRQVAQNDRKMNIESHPNAPTPGNTQGLATPKRRRIVTSDDESASSTPVTAAKCHAPAQAGNDSAAVPTGAAPATPGGIRINQQAAGRPRDIVELSDDDIWIRPNIADPAPVAPIFTTRPRAARQKHTPAAAALTTSQRPKRSRRRHITTRDEVRSIGVNYDVRCEM